MKPLPWLKTKIIISKLRCSDIFQVSSLKFEKDLVTNFLAQSKRVERAILFMSKIFKRKIKEKFNQNVSA